MEEKQALTIREIAKEFSFPEYAIRRLVKTGKINVIQCGNRCYITRNAFSEYLRKGGEPYACTR